MDDHNQRILYRGSMASGGQGGRRPCYAFRLPLWDFHSAFETFMRRSSSCIDTNDVRDFMAFSKSESRRTSLNACTMAALVACRIPSPVGGPIGVAADFLFCGLASTGLDPLSPRSKKTSQTRSCAGKGRERLKRVRYHRVPYAVASIPSSDYNQIAC